MFIHNYQIGRKIGDGAFGAVFQGNHRRTKEQVAIKLQSRVDASNTINMKYEAKIYQYLNSMRCEFVPQIKWFGVIEECHFLVMELLGERVSGSVHNAIDIGIQLIDALAYLHRCSLLHRDIKPANVLFGQGTKSNKIYLIDFGLAKRFEYNGKHIEFKRTHGLIGSPNFVSLNVHQRCEPSRRDDVESAIYVMWSLYMDLPWMNEELIEDIKGEFQAETELMQYVRGLEFDEAPDYERVKRILKGHFETYLEGTLRNVS
jgi:serine/threonine protein kinase